MRHIYQRCASDCFPTCVAMIAGISHRQAVQLIHPFREKGYEYATDDAAAIRVLRYLGFKVRKRHLKNFTTLKNPAIIAMDNGYGGGHVVVWDPVSKKILEPSKKDQHLPLSFYKKEAAYVFIIS